MWTESLVQVQLLSISFLTVHVCVCFLAKSERLGKRAACSWQKMLFSEGYGLEIYVGLIFHTAIVLYLTLSETHLSVELSRIKPDWSDDHFLLMCFLSVYYLYLSAKTKSSKQKSNLKQELFTASTLILSLQVSMNYVCTISISILFTVL